MARGRKRLRRSSGPVEDPESNEEDEEGQSTAPSTQTPAEAETTDQERLGKIVTPLSCFYLREYSTNYFLQCRTCTGSCT